MITYDGIIFSLQRSGGISVLFHELFSRLASNKCKYQVLRYDNAATVPAQDCVDQSSRILERYRDVKINTPGIFHSTYYRSATKDSVRCYSVTTVHDYTYERYVGGLRGGVHSWQKNVAIRKSDKIICVSESTRRDLLEYSGMQDESRLIVVPNGVSDSYHHIVNGSVESQVLFVGARGGYKNFEAAVVALGQLSFLRLVCVGGGAFSKKELALLNQHLKSRYHHAGFLSNEELNIEYNRSICLVYPSLYEGFGIPILEAMRAGCPVIAVNASSIPEVSADAAYLLEKGSAEEIKLAVEFFCVQENRKIYKERGFRQAEQFSWDSTYSKTVKVYEELLGHKLLEVS